LFGAADDLRLRHHLPIAAASLATRDAALAHLNVAPGTESAEAERLAGAYAALDSMIDDALGHIERHYRHPAGP
jgi:hypothetical protein